MIDKRGAGSKRPIHPMPDEISKALKERGLKQAYALRPPYQRNDYVDWITRAKRQETREKRLLQMLDELENGGRNMGISYKAKKTKYKHPTS